MLSEFLLVAVPLIITDFVRNIIQHSQEDSCEECKFELKKVTKLLKFQSLHHSIRRMFAGFVSDHVDELRTF